MMVSANSASCTPMEPIVAGPSARKNLRTSASSSGQRSAVMAPARQASPPTSSACKTPEISTPQAAAWPAVGKNAASASVTHHRQIEQDRSRGGGGKALQRVEDAAIERDQRDQQQIGKGDAGEFDGERKPAGVARKARRQHVDHRRREQQRHRQQHDLARQQQREDAVGKHSGARGAALRADAGIGRHEGGVEGAFGEDGAEMIGQPEGDEKGVGHRPGAEHRGQDDVADEAGEPRQQRQAADREYALNHR